MRNDSTVALPDGSTSKAESKACFNAIEDTVQISFDQTTEDALSNITRRQISMRLRTELVPIAVSSAQACKSGAIDTAQRVLFFVGRCVAMLTNLSNLLAGNMFDNVTTEIPT
jgi:hypothetical protein